VATLMSVNCLASKFIRCSRLMIDAPETNGGKSGAKIRIEIRPQVRCLNWNINQNSSLNFRIRFYPHWSPNFRMLFMRTVFKSMRKPNQSVAHLHLEIFGQKSQSFGPRSAFSVQRMWR